MSSTGDKSNTAEGKDEGSGREGMKAGREDKVEEKKAEEKRCKADKVASRGGEGKGGTEVREEDMKAGREGENVGCSIAIK